MEPPLRIHIHEDDWGMRVLMPLAALPEAESDLAEARNAEAGTGSTPGLGWSDVHIIRPPSLGYATIPLQVSDAAAALGPHFPRVRNFMATATAGFSSATKDPNGSYETDAECYGTGAACFIKLEHKDGIVHGIWFEAPPTAPRTLAGCAQCSLPSTPSFRPPLSTTGSRHQGRPTIVASWTATSRSCSATGPPEATP